MDTISLRKEKYDAIDLAKLIGSFLVVAIHTQIFSSFSEGFNNYFINVFSRIAVYFFLISSVWFFFKNITFENGKIQKSKENFKRMKKYILRLVILYSVWTIIYFLWQIPYWYQGGWLTIGNFVGYGLSCFVDRSYYHMWFLLSLIYAVPIMYFLLRYIKVKWFICIAVALYVVGLLYGAYSFVGMPFQNLFDLLGDKWPRIRTVIFNVIPICAFALIENKISLSKAKIRIIAVLMLILFSVEGVWLFGYSPNTASAYCVFTIPAVLFVFLFIKSINIEIKYNYILRKLSTLIYCMHPLIMGIFALFINKDNINSLGYCMIIISLNVIIGLMLIFLYTKFKCFKFLKYVM